MNLEQLSRREFLVGTGALAAAEPFPTTAIAADNRKSKKSAPRQISFKEAQADISLRQQYINQFVTKEFENDASKYFQDIIYDHDKSMVAKASVTDISKVLGDPAELEVTINHYLNDPQFRKLPEQEKDAMRIRLRASEEARDELKKYLELRNKKKLEVISKSAALVLHYSDRWGMQAKSTLYVFGDAFKDIVLRANVPKSLTQQEQITIPIKYPSTEELLRSRLQHEYTHAQDKFHGITINRELTISGSNVNDFDPAVLVFVEETRGYLRQIEFIREKFGTAHSAYAVSFKAFIDHMSEEESRSIISRFKGGKLTPHEERFVRYQIDQISAKTPQVLRFVQY
ncbi:MAG: hypothetical protein HY606_09520 [Planctomycetes bacterium]|nr:hypothetical protein [Planctomycetota bacterium]